MSYETGSSTDASDLLDKLRIFAIARGWTVNRWRDTQDTVTYGATAKELCLFKSGAYVNLWSDDNIDDPALARPRPHIRHNLSPGFDAGLDTWSQTDASPTPRTTHLGGPYVGYHFFSSTEAIYIVVEVSPGVFNHFGFGTLNKASSYVGGAFLYGTDWERTLYIHSPTSDRHATVFEMLSRYSYYGSTIVRHDVDNTPDWYDSSGYQPTIDQNQVWTTNPRRGTHNSLLNPLWHNTWSPNHMNSIAPMMPVIIGTQRGPTLQRHIIGTAPNVRFLNIEYLLPKQIVTYGTDDWMVFPYYAKYIGSAPSGTPSSGVYGVAFLKD